MDSKKNIVLSIINFLKSDVESNCLGNEKTESLEVVIQCLEDAYDLSSTSAQSNFNLLHAYEQQLTKGKSNTTSAEDKQKAESMKASGNDLMKSCNFQQAVEQYTKAIEIDSNNAVYYCNRAAAYTKLEESLRAVADCEKAIEIDPTYGKAYGRMGLVYLNESNYKKAVENYEKAIKLEPENSVYKNNLDLARDKMATTKPTAANPLAGLDLSSMLSNPAVVNMAQSFMQNPQMQNMFANMMGGAGGGVQPPPQENTTNNTPTTDNNTGDTTGAAQPPPAGGFQLPPGMDFANILNATQSFAQQMEQDNPDLLGSLRQQFQQGQQPPSNPDDTK